MTQLKQRKPLGGLAPWFGAKRRMAPRIVEVLGRHTAYWEPFGGSLAVLLQKPPCAQECVCDLHGDLINLARVVASDSLAVRLYDALSRTLCHEDVFASALESLEDPWEREQPCWERARDYMIASWLGRNGLAGTPEYNSHFSLRFGPEGSQTAPRFVSAVESIPQWHQRLRSVAIYRRDAFEVIERIHDKSGVAIYLDPPYLVKNGSYVHDFTAADHERLAVLLRRFRQARVVVSYYQDPQLLQLYPKWQQVQINVSRSLSNTSARPDRAEEVLLVNAQPTLFSLF